MTGRAIVLGAAGFIGRHVARAMAAKGYAVAGLGHGDWDAATRERWGVREWCAGDVTEESLAALAGGGPCDVLVQCAGSGSVAASIQDPANDYRRNVDTTLTALEYVRCHAPRCRFVLPSSAAVYGQVVRLPITIDAPLVPVSPYGVHKKMAELLAESYARQFGIQAIIVRLFSIYGVGLQKQLLWDACTKLSQGDVTFSGTGREERDWLHVDDAANLLVAAAGHVATSCPVVNGGSGVSVPIRTVIDLLRGPLDVGEELRFDGAIRAGDPLCYRADIASVADWDWHPRRNLAEETQHYARWFLAGRD